MVAGVATTVASTVVAKLIARRLDRKMEEASRADFVPPWAESKAVWDIGQALDETRYGVLEVGALAILGLIGSVNTPNDRTAQERSWAPLTS